MTFDKPQLVSRHRLPPYDYQVKAFDFIHYHGSCYLMLDMGMGKTRTCIEVGKTISEPMFILANKFAAIDTWPDEFKKWDPTAKVALLHGRNKERIWANSDEYTNIIMTYDGLKWFYEVAQKHLRPLQKYFFVFDEASMIKNSESVRWKILHDIQPIMSNYRVALSGTPAPQSLADLWAQYYMLDQGRALCPSFYQFRSRFFDYTGPDGSPPYQTTIKSWAPKEIFRIIKPITMRMDAEDYHKLPELIFNPIYITMPPRLRKMYDALEEDFMLEMKDSTVIANSSAVLGHKLRQFVQGGMYATAVDTDNDLSSRCRLRSVAEHVHAIKAKVVQQLLETAAGKPMLVAVQFRFEIGILQKLLRRKLPAITGATSAAKGREYIQQWNRGELPIMVVHPKSVAYSLNLQAGGNQIVFVALPWELDLYKQLIKRLHRPGQEAETVVVSAISFKDTVDEKVAKYLQRKEQTQQGLFDAITKGR